MMVPDIAPGQIWKEKGAKGIKCYVTRVDQTKFEYQNVFVLYSDGRCTCQSDNAFTHSHEYTGDHVPFEDVAAVLF